MQSLSPVGNYMPYAILTKTRHLLKITKFRYLWPKSPRYQLHLRCVDNDIFLSSNVVSINIPTLDGNITQPTQV